MNRRLVGEKKELWSISLEHAGNKYRIHGYKVHIVNCKDTTGRGLIENEKKTTQR